MGPRGTITTRLKRHVNVFSLKCDADFQLQFKHCQKVECINQKRMKVKQIKDVSLMLIYDSSLIFLTHFISSKVKE